MAIEIIPKPKEVKPYIAKNILFYLVMGLLVIEISGYFVLDFYQDKSEKEIHQLGVALSEARTEEIKDLERKVLEDKERIDDFASLLDSHKRGSKFFSFLESLCHPRVFFSGINLDVEGDKVSLSGKAESFQVLGQQISILKEQRIINNVYLSELSLGKAGEVNFSLSFSINPQMFK